MTEKRTSHVMWAILTLIGFCFGFLVVLPIIGWIVAANSTRKHNIFVAAKRHEETITALKAGQSVHV